MAHGEFKTAGGKLVIVDFDVVDGRLANVEVSGDFFLEPPEALDQINAAVDGQPVSASDDDLATAIASALYGDVEMVGFSPAAVAQAVRRGLE